MAGLAIARGIIRIEAALAAALEVAEQRSLPAVESVVELQEVMDSQVAGHLAHALHTSAGYFNNHSIKKHCHKLARAIEDPQLSFRMTLQSLFIPSLMQISWGCWTQPVPVAQMDCCVLRQRLLALHLLWDIPLHMDAALSCTPPQLLASPFKEGSPASALGRGAHLPMVASQPDQPHLLPPGTHWKTVANMWSPLPAALPSQVGAWLSAFISSWPDIGAYEASLNLVQGYHLESESSPPSCTHGAHVTQPSG